MEPTDKIKIIFLDIDGVLNSNAWYVKRVETVPMDSISAQYPFYEFDPNAVKRLNRITDITGAKIVVSSTWRHGRTTEQLKTLFSQVGITGEVIGRTPSLNVAGDSGYTIPRGCEIDVWLRKNDFQRINWCRKTQNEYLAKSQIQNYIILDDDSDMLYNQREHFVKTPYMMGLTDKHVRSAIKILNTSIIDLYYPKNWHGKNISSSGPVQNERTELDTRWINSHCGLQEWKEESVQEGKEAEGLCCKD